MADTTPTELFQKALSAYGQDYLDTETALRAGGETTSTALKKIAADTGQTPLGQFIAATIAAWIDGKGKNFSPAMGGLKSMANRAAESPRGLPSPDAAAGRLARFSDISDFVALRMLKETDWPEWKVLASIIHLGHWGTASVLPAIDQFRADLTSGKRPVLGDITNEQTQATIEKLDEAAQLVAIVIKDETFQSGLSKVKKSTGTDQQAALEEAVTRALSLITADQERAKQIDTSSETLKTLLLAPVLQATEGVVDPDQVRQILAKFLLGTSDEG